MMLIILAVVTTPLGLVWLWPQSRIAMIEVAGARDDNRVVARVLARSLGRQIGEVSERFGAVAGTLRSGATELQLSGQMGDLTFLARYDAVNGTLLRGTVGSGGAPPARIDGATIALLAGATRPSEQAGTEPIRGAIAALVPVLGSAPALYLIERDALGFIVGAVDMDRFVAHLNDLSGGGAWSGSMVAMRGDAITGLLATQSQGLGAVPPGALARALASSTGSDVLLTPDGKPFVIGLEKIDSAPGIAVAVVRPVASLRGLSEEHNRTTLLIFALGLLAAALVAFRSGLVVVEPLQALLEAVRRMEQGEEGVRVPMPGRLAPREIGTLASAFNAMADTVMGAKRRESEARERAERACEQKSEVLRYVTHEMRTPANAILGFSQLLSQARHGSLGSPIYESYVQDILNGSKHLLSLINDLLDMSKIEAGKYHLHEEAVGIDEIIERVVRFLQPQVDDRAMVLTVDYDDPPPTLKGDERALFQIVLNLATNAVRYGYHGGRIGLMCEVNAEGCVEVAVVDNGPGIPEEHLAKVLEPFHRVESAHVRRTQGTGLGLPIVSRLVGLHGGHFQIESEEGIGTVCRIVFPAERTIVADLPASSPIVSVAA